MDNSRKSGLIGEELMDLGSVRIADEVIASIAGIATMDVPGVVGMSSGLIGGMAEMMGKKSTSKGVKVQVGAREVAVDLYIVVEYGLRIPDVALQVQEKVKEALGIGARDYIVKPFTPDKLLNAVNHALAL